MVFESVRMSRLRERLGAFLEKLSIIFHIYDGGE